MQKKTRNKKMADSLGELFIELAFEGNTEEAEKFKKTINETAKAMQKTAEKALKNADAQKKDTQETKDNNKEKSKQKDNLKSVIKAFTGYVAAISGAIFAVKKLTDSLIEQNRTWLNLTRTSDIALSTYQKWNSVGKMYGINNAAEQIKNLNDRLFELKLTGANAQGFMLAGIRPTNADDVMEQLRARVSGLSDSAAAYLLRQLGLDENLLHILRLSRNEFQALNTEVKRFQLTDKQRASIQEMNVQLQIASMKLQYLKDRAILAILPHWVRFQQNSEFAVEKIAKLVKWFAKLETKFKLLIAGSAIGLSKIKPIANFFGKLSKTITKLTIKIPIFGRVLAGLGGIFSRYFWWLTAFYYLIDDIRAYSQGYDSGIGYLEVFFKKMRSFSEIDFFDKLEKILNHPIPEWLKSLLKGIDRIERLYRYNSPEFEANLENTKTKILERLKNATPEEKAFYLSFTNDDLLNYGSLENAYKQKFGKELPISPALLDKLNTNFNNEVFNNGKNINVQQYNTFNTNEAAKDIYSSLLPWTGAINFANKNLSLGTTN